MASNHTISTVPRISSHELSQIILAANTSSNLDNVVPPKHLAVVDVRDDDHIGGHIRNSIHAPSQTLDTAIPSLVRRLADKEIVVFHCALSQQRGPSAALRYLREKERLNGMTPAPGSSSRAEGEGGEAKKEQKVYILRDGFVGWQERYGEDSRLTESYLKSLWKDGYWM